MGVWVYGQFGLWVKVLSGDMGKFTSQGPRLGKGTRHRWGTGEAEVLMLKLWQEADGQDPDKEK